MDADVQELKMRSQGFRDRERRFKDELVAAAAANGHKDRFHLPTSRICPLVGRRLELEVDLDQAAQHGRGAGELVHGAVLTARTVCGDFILDNMVDEVKVWHRSGYEFIMRQPYLNPLIWLSVNRSPETRGAMTSSAPAPSQKGLRPLQVRE